MRDFVALREAMDRIMNEGMPVTGNGKGVAELRPAVDAYENEDEVVLEVVLPGVQPEDVEVTFDKDSLTVAGTIPMRDGEQTWVLRERGRGVFKRRFALQTPIDIDKVDARFDKGILTLRLPKSEAVKPRKIAVLSN
jgi:HSP20 family protein